MYFTGNLKYVRKHSLQTLIGCARVKCASKDACLYVPVSDKACDIVCATLEGTHIDSRVV